MKVYINLNLRQRAEEAAGKADDLWSKLRNKVENLADVVWTKVNEIFDEIKAEIAKQCEVVEDPIEAELVIVTETAEAIKFLAAGKEVVQILYGQEPISAAAVAGIGGESRIHLYAIAGVLYQGKHPGLSGLLAFMISRLGLKESAPADAASPTEPAV